MDEMEEDAVWKLPELSDANEKVDVNPILPVVSVVVRVSFGRGQGGGGVGMCLPCLRSWHV